MTNAQYREDNRSSDNPTPIDGNTPERHADVPVWSDVWKANDFDVCVQRHETGVHRMVAGGGMPGAVAVIRNERDEVAVVKQMRLAVGETLWEFPRGFGSAGDVDVCDTALREFTEETGLHAQQAQFLGWVWPDSGLLGNAVGVVGALLTDEAPGERDGEVSELHWVSIDVLRKWVRQGRVRDGITLSAYALLRESDLSQGEST